MRRAAEVDAHDHELALPELIAMHLGVLAIRDPGEHLERRRSAVAKHVEAPRLERDLACPLRSFGCGAERGRGPRRAVGTRGTAAGLGRLGLRLAHRRE